MIPEIILPDPVYKKSHVYSRNKCLRWGEQGVVEASLFIQMLGFLTVYFFRPKTLLLLMKFGQSGTERERPPFRRFPGGKANGATLSIRFHPDGFQECTIRRITVCPFVFFSFTAFRVTRRYAKPTERELEEAVSRVFG